MEINITYLLAIVLIIVGVLIILIIFEGRTNKKITTLLGELDHLKKDMEKKDRQMERLSEIFPSQRAAAKEKKIYDPEQELPKEYVEKTSNKEQQEALKAALKAGKHKKNIFQKLFSIPAVQKYTGEVFITANLMHLIGVVIFTIGIGFFVKYAFDNQWMNATGRVAAGIFAGGLLLFVGHLLHRKYRTFSSILLGGALAIQYFSLAIAYDEYQLLPVWATFAVMLILTGFAVFLSLSYNRQELIILSLLAGFTAPLLVNFNIENYLELFSYISVIITGMLILAYFKKWMLVNLLTLGFTIVFFAWWLIITTGSEMAIPYIGALAFATGFYYMFFYMNILSNIVKRKKFLPFELSVLIFITVMYYTAGMVIIESINPAYKGLFTAIIAVFNFIHLMILYRDKRVDKNLLYLLIGLILVFVTLVPPVELVGKTITLVWSLQIVLLLWLSQRIDVELMKLGSAFMSLLLLASMGMDMYDIYVSATPGATPMPPIINKGFIINFIAVCALVVNVILLGKEKREYLFVFVKVLPFRIFLAAAALVSFYFTVFLELKYQLIQDIELSSVVNLYIGVYNYIFILLLASPALFIKQRPLKLLTGFWATAGFILYSIYYQWLSVEVRNSYLLESMAGYGHFLSHYFISAIIIGLSILAIFYFNRFSHNKKIRTFSLWLVSFIILYVLSAELDHIYVLNNYREGLLPSELSLKAHKLPYTLFWGVSSLIFMVIGIFRQVKPLRQVSLAIMIVTIGKLFIYDMKYISRGEQITAFITLGLCLVLLSFIHQRFGNSLPVYQNNNS